MLPTDSFYRKQSGSSGFTLIEMLVVVSIVGIIAVFVTSFLFTSLSGSGKAEVTKEVRQNGAYALAVMQDMIRNSLAVSSACTSGGATGESITILNQDYQSSTFSCAGGKVSSNSADLTSPELVEVAGCQIKCTKQIAEPALVEIAFTVSQATLPGQRVSEKASLDFRSTVNVKNYR